MRLLRFDFRDDLASIDLHPLITVLSDLAPAHQRHLFEAVRRLSSGLTVGLRGLIEHQGLLVELDAGTGDPLGSVTTSATALIYVDGSAIECDELGLRAEIEQWERRAAVDAVAVEEIRSDLDLAIRARMAQIDGALTGDRRADYLDPRQLMLDTIGRAVELVGSAERAVVQCDPSIKTLLDRWDVYRTRRQVAEEHLFQLAVGVQQAEAEVLDQRRALEMAEAATKTVGLSAEQEARLEELSDDGEDDSTQSRLWRRAPSPADEAERQRLLDLAGVASWTEYSVMRTSPDLGARQDSAVLMARAGLERAQAALARAEAGAAQDETAAALQFELDQLRADCQPVLGPVVPEDVGGALLAMVTTVENPRWLDALNNLRDALSSNDVHPPFGLEPDQLVTWTRSWLEAQHNTVGTDYSVHSAVDGPADNPVDGAAASAVDEDAVPGALTQILARHNRALAQIDRAEGRAAASAGRVEELRAQLQARTAGPRVSTAAEVLAMVAPVAERILLDVGGSLPIVVAGDMAGLPDGEVEAMMGALEEVAQQVQVILVSGHPGITAWADRAGLERASTTASVRAMG